VEARFKVGDFRGRRGRIGPKPIPPEHLYFETRQISPAVPPVRWQCPVGPHDDPGLAFTVKWACGISKVKVKRVAVQCSQGHWASYSC
jgi:hypothetical protein